jgi:hypothetical protein
VKLAPSALLLPPWIRPHAKVAQKASSAWQMQQHLVKIAPREGGQMKHMEKLRMCAKHAKLENTATLLVLPNAKTARKEKLVRKDRRTSHLVV